jgi:AAA family ATP:ADP antiporter
LYEARQRGVLEKGLEINWDTPGVGFFRYLWQISRLVLPLNMKERLRKLLGVDEHEFGPVFLLLLISFLMGLFVATITVAAQAKFLEFYDEGKDLPVALVISGAFGLVATAFYTFLQGRVSFNSLAITSLGVIILITAGIEFGEVYIHDFFEDANFVHFIAFTQILPFVFISQLIFWGSFGRLFNLRQAKRVIGSVDIGVDIASLIAFFSIPVLLEAGLEVESLYTIALASIIGFLLLFLILSKGYLNQATINKSDVGNDYKISRLGVSGFIKSKYIVALSLFVIVSITALRFVDYSFFNVATRRFPEPAQLANFLSLFEGTIVVFGILFGTFATDRITADYGLRVSLILNPLLLIVFTAGALALGLSFGYEGGESMIFFFIMVAMSKLFVNALKGALDDPVFKMYYIPINKAIKLDAQTKIEGMITAFASIAAGGLLVFINAFEFTDLISITIMTLPILVLWYLVTNRMYGGYKETLQESLTRGRKSTDDHSKKEYTMDKVLEKEVSSDAESKVIYGLKLMERLEPALFESSLIRLAQSELRRVRQFAESKIADLGFNQEPGEMKGLALQAAGDAEASDLLSISAEKLMKLSKSVKQTDRILAAKLLRKLVSQKTIFILLELLRDQDPKVRTEALLTARRVKRTETWPVLIELISSPAYSHHAIAALKEAGEPALPVLEGAFHKSGQSDLVVSKGSSCFGKK